MDAAQITERHPPLQVQRMLVLRPNAIGDFVFALPALHALRQRYPQAHIVFLGLQWHWEFLRGRPGPIDEVRVMPPVPGITAAADAPLEADTRHFIAGLQQERFDLALQIYGGGRYANPFIQELGARTSIGMKTADATPLDRWIPYSALANRRLELLQVAALADAAPPLAERELEITPADRAAAHSVLPHSPHERIVVVHPGASDPRRRWPAERFALVADALAEAGATVVLSAAGSEAALTREIAARMRHRPLDPERRLTLPALCGLLERAVMIVANDTGPLHLALALGTPALGIFWLSNLLESAPLRPHLLRAALSARVHCPVCGQENRHARCAHDVSFVDDVSVAEVREMALDWFAALR